MSRSHGRDITELFGYAPDDISTDAVAAFSKRRCPFVLSECTKTNHDQTEIYGTCSVSNGISKSVSSEVIICPKRLYANNHATLRRIANLVWPEVPDVLIGGDQTTIRNRMHSLSSVIVGFGQGSVSEVHAEANGEMSFDWILQKYERSAQQHRFTPSGFVAVEVQSIDTTGNYRENWASYERIKLGGMQVSVAKSNHGLNWANVHKRLIPQIIRKGTLASKSQWNRGFFFVVPSAVYEKFQEVVGPQQSVHTHGKGILSITPVKLGKLVQVGSIRDLVSEEAIHCDLRKFALAFIDSVPESATAEFDLTLRSLL